MEWLNKEKMGGGSCEGLEEGIKLKEKKLGAKEGMEKGKENEQEMKGEETWRRKEI